MSTWKLLKAHDGSSIAVDMEHVAWIKANLGGNSVVYFNFCKGDALVNVEVKETPEQIVMGK
jgi:hypothetical protein